MTKRTSMLMRCMVGLFSLTVAMATPINFHNTGLVAPDPGVLGATGAVDGYWKLLSGANAYDLCSIANSCPSSDARYNAGWAVPMDSTSNWIGDNSSASSPTAQASNPGNLSTPAFVAQTTFTVDTARLTQNLILTGRVAFDDCGFVFVNTFLVMQDCGSGGSNYVGFTGATGFSSWTPLTIPTADLIGNATNTLTVYDYNTGGSYGLRLELADVTTSLPEPLTFGMVLAGCGLIALRKRSLKA